MRRNILLFFALALAPEALAQKAPSKPDVPFVLPTPEGWRTETLHFPLEFAPQLPYQGLEELRFSPGMFKPGREDFWTYAFVFWPVTHKAWKQLERIREGFRCSKGAEADPKGK
jgi:hypothetical protein